SRPRAPLDAKRAQRLIYLFRIRQRPDPLPEAHERPGVGVSKASQVGCVYLRVTVELAEERLDESAVEERGQTSRDSSIETDSVGMEVVEVVLECERPLLRLPSVE